MQANNNASADAMWRKLVADNGYQYFNVPIDSRPGPSIVAVPTDHGKVTLVDTATDNVYQMPAPTAGATSSTGATQYTNTQGSVNAFPTSQSRPVNQVYPRTEHSTNGDSGMFPGKVIENSRAASETMSFNPTPGTGKLRFIGPMSRWTKHDVREGLRILSASAMERIKEPDTPTKYDADSQFNDALYMSLQGDIRPTGANPVDDYLNAHANARLRMYKEIVIGRQECQCECSQSDLDQYLHRNQDANSAIYLRATLSDDCRHKVQEPKSMKPVMDKVDIVKGQVSEILKWAEEYSKSEPVDQRNPMNAQDEDESLRIN